jgi:prevent-host-death family protein
MSQMSPSEDIRSVTELKRNTREILDHSREILDHLHATGRPVILTVNGRADAVLLDVRVYERYLSMKDIFRRGIWQSSSTRPNRTRKVAGAVLPASL